MSRPHAINEPARDFNVMLPVRVVEALRQKAHDERTFIGTLIRRYVLEGCERDGVS